MDYGALGDLFEDPRVGGVYMSSHDAVIVERDGIHEEAASPFAGDAGGYRRLLSSLAGTGPVASGRDGGIKYSVVLPPIASGDSGQISLRRWAPFFPTLEDLVVREAMTADAATYLRNAIRARACVVVYGGAGSGRTSTLRALACEMQADTPRPVGVVEDSCSLGLSGAAWHVTTARRGGEEASAGELVRSAQRAGMDGIVLDGAHGDAAAAVLSAMIFGTQCLTTLHASDAVSALISLSGQASSGQGWHFPEGAVAEAAAGAVQVLVGVRRDAVGHRSVFAVDEVDGRAEGEFLTNPVFRAPTVPGQAVVDPLRAVSGYATSPQLAAMLRARGLPYAVGEGPFSS